MNGQEILVGRVQSQPLTNDNPDQKCNRRVPHLNHNQPRELRSVLTLGGVTH